MKKISIVLFLAISCCFVLSAQDKETKDLAHPTVLIKSGLVQGLSEAGVKSFKGIPYAAPPVGKFRWRPPQPVSSWEGIRDATEYGPNCAQAGWGAAPGTISEGSSEDCLYLNLWLPANTEPGANLPVMVWIHGGGFVGGSGSSPGGIGNEFAKQGVILMTFNYRLGRLGHFAFPALSQEHPNEPKGSYAFMDQIAALEWVQDNIKAFGGDPDNVTIFGFSAGGVSVHSLLTMPAAHGLFHKAISHSGGGRAGVLTGRPIDRENADPFYTVSAETIGVNFARKHGIEGVDAEALSRLRAMTVQEVVDGGQETDGEGGPRTYAGPILDGQFVLETSESAYKAGRQANVPLMIGNCSAEIGGPFVNNSTSKEELFSLFGELSNEAKAAYDPANDKEFDEIVTRFNTDWVWGEPARMVARKYLSEDQPVYVFHFDYVPPSRQSRSRYGAWHGAEIEYVFNTLEETRQESGFTEQEKQLAKIMNTYWVNFAKTGNPNCEGLPEWPLYNTESEIILEIEPNGIPVAKSDPRKARLDVIEKAHATEKERVQSRGI